MGQPIDGVEQPPDTPPDALDATYRGESDAQTVISTLQFLYDEAESSLKSAESEEEAARTAYEAMIKQLKEAEQLAVEAIAAKDQEIAQCEENKMAKQQELHKTKEDVSALDKYSTSIRPNCDFILSNYDTRKQQRQAEKTALEDVLTILAQIG
mmetsp:Transcript_6779/g.16465  ORF Transcript_6779/g.16465 Transcript_6779/m.16465 type:complete len:154 (-) Transcript_6779:153-614(-)